MGIDYSDILYEQSNGLDDIARASMNMVARAGAKINVFLFSGVDDPAGELVEWAPASRRPGVARRGAKQVLTIDVEGGTPVRVAVARDSRTPSINYAVSDCPSTAFKNRFVSLVDRHVPTFSRIILSNAEMIKILDGVAAKGFDIEVKYSSTSEQRTHGGLDSHLDYISIPYKKFHSKIVTEKEKMIKTIRIVCTPLGLADKEGASAPNMLTMTRDCRFSASRNATILFDDILPRVAEMAESRTSQLRSSASTASRRKSEPLIINFGRDIFADPDKNKDHIAALASIPRCSISVYHLNPYIHASLVDYSDCSSYDIWVLVNDKLAIVPQVSATESSMGRLVNHIFEKMGGGRIEKYERKYAGK